MTSATCRDRVFIDQLDVDAVIGVYDWERDIRQRLQLDIEMGFDNRIPAASDDVADTLDYDAISRRLSAYVAQSQFALVETLAERCAQLLQDEFGVRWLRIKLSKPGAVGNARAVGVLIERGQP
ncbi:dihydroneopterin aldolase [Pseudoxanthomonas dokdonensis]|uniref:7,8-dihydroneopterin aldolase n=1 Tax=Pseudoxanthomonas dokdonensis TaxID=344882 RepID=A0A0R0CRZ5_9GAMM|nr:dihydroneopterin aldolase [Pseudoxanthomonas dokdonensis]KRG68372.1 dihydroneopterin aldolase [Pseudoxanthomonas dokdonensis]